MSELTEKSSSVSPADNEWTKKAAYTAHLDTAANDGDQEAVAAARWAVAEYLRDIGLRDPELIARESHQMVARAQRQLAFSSHKVPLTEAAIQLTVRQLDHWLMALAADSPGTEPAPRPGSVAGARLPELLSRYPQALRQKRP